MNLGRKYRASLREIDKKPEQTWLTFPASVGRTLLKVNMETIQERFWSKVEIKNKNDCWHWKVYTDKKGYGRFKMNYRTMQSQRVAYELFYGKFKSELWVLHKCDTPSCNNPYHLFLGTVIDNDLDRDSKRRTARGSKHGRSLLDEENVKEIKELLSKRISHKEIAKIFTVSKSAIHKISAGYCWTHIF